MYFPKGYDDKGAIELGRLVAEAYEQFRAYEDKTPWGLSEGYALLGELKYPRKALELGEKGGKLESYLRKLPQRGGKAEADIPIGFVAQKGGRCSVIFRGTQTAREWVSNLNTKLNPCLFEGYGSVHEGFQNSYAEIRSELLEMLRKVSGTARIFVAGHSLGGAFATLASIDIERSLGRNIAALYTYGSPRVGDAAFARAFNARFAKKSFRIANSSDLVTELPFPAPIAGFVGGYFSHVDTPVLSTLQLGEIEENHRIETYLLSLEQNRRRGLFRRPGEPRAES